MDIQKMKAFKEKKEINLNVPITMKREIRKIRGLARTIFGYKGKIIANTKKKSCKSD